MDDIYQVLEYFRVECAHVKKGVPTGYPSSLETLVKWNLLVERFYIKWGLYGPGSSPSPHFLHWESIGTEAQ